MNCHGEKERMKWIYTTKPAIIVGWGKEQQSIEMEPIQSAERSTYELRNTLQEMCIICWVLKCNALL